MRFKNSVLLFSLGVFFIQLNFAYSQKKQKTSDFQKLSKAVSLIEKNKLDEAFLLAEALSQSKDLGDYGSFLKGEIYYKKSKKKNTFSNLNRAIDIYSKIDFSDPYSFFPKKIQTRYLEIDLDLAHYFYQNKNSKRAMEYYEKFFKRGTHSQWLRYLSREGFENYIKNCVKKTSDECRFWIQELLSVYPANSFQSNLVKKLILNKTNFDKSTTPTYARIFENYPSRDEDVVLYQKGLDEFFDEDYSDAIDYWDELTNNFKKSNLINSIKFFKAFIDRDSEQSSQLLNEVYTSASYAFYGVYSGFLLKKPIHQRISNAVITPIADDPSLTLKEKATVKKIIEFKKEKLNQFIFDELEEFKIKPYFSFEFLAYIAQVASEVKNDLTVFKVISELISRGDDRVFSSFFLEKLFPIRYWDQIQTIAKGNDLDPILALSLIKQESAFRESALSSSGAIGLMQLMPFTALEVNPGLDFTSSGNISVNLDMGTKYLSSVIKQFNGNWVYALAGYNAGPFRVKQWLLKHSKKYDMIQFIESIPYGETKNYVTSIMRNYYWYSQLINKKTEENFDRFWSESKR